MHLSVLSPRVRWGGGGVADPGEFDILREARVKFPTPRTTNAPINLKPAGGGGKAGHGVGISLSLSALRWVF